MNDDHQTTTRLADHPIAIVGLSSLFPMARNLGEFWQNIVSAADCTTEVPATHWNIDDYYDPDPAAPDKTYCRRGGFVPEVPFSVTEFGMPPNLLEVTNVVQLLSLMVARDVLADAGATGAGWYRPDRTGVVLGVTGPTTLSHPLAARLATPVLKEVVRACGLTQADADQIAEKYAAAFAPWEENSFPGLLGNVIAGRIANRLDLGGMNCTVDAACASSLSAVHMAIGELVSGRADLMITGGCDTQNSIFEYMCFAKVGALSKGGYIKPLDEDADGTLVGEGIGMLALKRLSDAQRDGDRVYAVIRGMGSSSDGRFKSIYAPRAEGQQAALHRAYEDADCSPSSIGLFEAHATGTRVGDATELEALTSVLRETTDETGYAAIGSVKSQIGHTKGAAGAASLIKLAMSLHHKVLPATINVSKPNHAIDSNSPLYVNTRTRPWILDPRRPRRAAASAMGFGGTNFHAVLEETTSGRAELRTVHRTARVHLWHAADVRELAASVRSGDSVDGGEIPADHARVGFVARDEQEASALRELAARELESNVDSPEWTHPKGIFFRRHALAESKVGALFAGQGSQYVDMGLTAVVNNPTVAGAFDEANAVFEDSERPLAGVVFPPPVFDPEERNEQENVLRRTEYAQPAIGALSAGQYRFLAERGLECGGFLGHSFGELTALWAAGSLDDADFFGLAKARGAAMALSGDGDPGAMAAVQATREEVTEILREHSEVSICNHNAPTQIVVGGGSDAVAALVSACRERGLAVRELPVAAAFHTQYVAHAVEPFREAVKGVSIRAPKGRVYANSEGAEYGSRVATNRRVLAEQLLKPVEFVAGLRAMHADGCRVFVEFGPKGVLTQLVRRTLGDDVVAIPTDAGPTGDGDVALKKAALRLAVLGVRLEALHRHDAPPAEIEEPQGMVVRLNGRDHVPDSRRALYRQGLDSGTELEAVASARGLGGGAGASDGVAAASGGGADVSGGVAAASGVAAGPAGGAAAASASGAAAASSPVDVPVSAAAAGPASGAVADAGAATAPAAAALATNGATAPAIPSATASPAPSAAGPAAAPATANGIATSGAAVTPARPDALVAATGASPAGASIHNGPGVDAVAQQHLDLHGQYAEGQLRVAEDLVSVLREAQRTGAVDDRLYATVDAVKEHSLALGQTHTRVNEILASLTALEFGDAGHHPTDYAEPADPPSLPESTLPQLAPAAAQPFAPTAPGSAAAQQFAPVAPAPAAPQQSTPATAEPTPPPANGTAPASAGSDIQSVLVEVVAEKTGYPAEMLDLSMDLEADLGVDSIKRVQILGALKDRVEGVPAVGPEQVAELRTLNDIVAFVGVAPVSVGSDVRSVLVEVVAEKTGYPAEMLDLSMDLEADLGVDSIKRVQILGALKDRVEGVPAVGPEQVAELRTLNDIVTFVGAPAETSEESTTDTANTTDTTNTTDTANTPTLLRIEQVRLPAVDRLDEPYATGKTALVVDYGEPTAAVLANALEQDGWIVHRVDAGGQEDAPLSTWDGQRIEETLGKALEPATRLDLCLTVLPADGQWQAGTRRLADTILTAKVVHDRLTATAESTRAAFVTVTRIDGALGHRGDRPAAASLVGGIGGLAKTLAQETPALFCRALDLAPELTDEAVTAAVLDELADAATDANEVAVDADRSRWTVRPRPIADPTTGEPAISTDDVLVVTGGGRGVTAHCVRELAARTPAEFVLLGRTELTGEPDWATGVADDALKPAAIAALHGEKPKHIDRVTRDLLAQREIRATVTGIEATGARVHYVAVDVTDAEATKAALAPYQARVTGIVHGAGALADALLPAKTPADIRTVLATKVDGLHNVVAALAEADLRHVILFGSVAGVLGNPGQADYAVANEALNRVAISWKRQRPASQVTTINWGAWDGGMVTADLRQMFLARGVTLLGMDDGARLFAEQFTPARADDVSVLAGPPNPLAPPAVPATTPAFTAHRDLAGLANDPVLLDHRIGQHPVLPAAAALGWLVNVLERANPGLRVVECSGFEVLKGIVYDGGHERDYWVDAEAGVSDGDRLTVKAWIRSAEPGKPLPRAHFGGTFVLAAGPAAAPAGTAYPVGEGEEDGPDVVYRSASLFHGALLQGMRRIIQREERRLVAECRLADTPLGHGEFAGSLHSPVLADVLLQPGTVLGVWFLGSGCLPLSVGRVEYYEPLPGDSPFVVVADDLRANSDRTQATVTVTASDPDGRVLQRVTDLSVIATPEMTAKFAEAVRLWEENR